MKPRRIQVSRRKGFNLQSASLALNGLPAVNVSRPSRWGNPYRIGVDGTQAEVVELFRRNWGMYERLKFPELPNALRGKNLACWCPLDKPCHADVLLEIANLRALTPPLKGSKSRV